MLPCEIEIVGSAPTLTLATAVLTQLFMSVPVTVYEVASDGDTEILEEPEPVLQLYVLAPDAFKIAAFPLHTERIPLTETVGNGFTIRLTVAVLEQPVDVKVPVTE